MLLSESSSAASKFTMPAMTSWSRGFAAEPAAATASSGKVTQVCPDPVPYLAVLRPICGILPISNELAVSAVPAAAR
jgi:hypothetical protein